MRLRLLDSSPRSVDCGTTYIYTYNFFFSCSTTLGVPVLSLLLDPVSLSGLFFLFICIWVNSALGLASVAACDHPEGEDSREQRRPTPKARRGDGLVDNISIFFFFLFQFFFFLVSVPESRRERGVIDGDETPAGACTVLRGSGGSHVAPSPPFLKKKIC